ncbi:MAG: hypothetical protein JNK67_04230 [Alphaproteobacteria bacterium]|nr:hypothetical protein [Alphaproteobacteria bacterium]
MKEFLYGIDSGVIAAVLFVSLVAVVELGYRLGLRSRHTASEDAKSHINAIQGSILGILALLLGFTFSLSLQRYDARSEAVVEEANAIGTAYLRAQLLHESVRDDVLSLLRDYADVRVRAGDVSVVDSRTRDATTERTLALQGSLWAQARRAAEVDPHPVRTGTFIPALNEVIDDFGKRDAALDRHVPELVLLLLYVTFLMAGAIVGLACGVAGHRPSLVSYIMITLIVVLVFIILDLDRPRRGLIEVSQKPLVDLQLAIRNDTVAPRSVPARK